MTEPYGSGLNFDHEKARETSAMRRPDTPTESTFEKEGGPIKVRDANSYDIVRASFQAVQLDNLRSFLDGFGLSIVKESEIELADGLAPCVVQMENEHCLIVRLTEVDEGYSSYVDIKGPLWIAGSFTAEMLKNSSFVKRELRALARREDIPSDSHEPVADDDRVMPRLDVSRHVDMMVVD